VKLLASMSLAKSAGKCAPTSSTEFWVEK
jgi:hypothetical protein